MAAIATYVAARNNTRQLGAQIFLAYSDRAREIRRSAALDSHDPGDTLDTIFLVFELYELRRKGYVSTAIWSIWSRDIGDLLRANHFRAQWDVLKARLHNHVHFVDWVEAQLKNDAPSPRLSWSARRSVDDAHDIRDPQ